VVHASQTLAATDTALEMVSLASLVLKDHLLRKIDAMIDSSFVPDRLAVLSRP
jgi:hypothetical protein